MKIENKIRVFAGFIVFTTAILGFFGSKYWLLITMFVGLNLFQFGFSNFCPLEKILIKLEKNNKNTKNNK